MTATGNGPWTDGPGSDGREMNGSEMKGRGTEGEYSTERRVRSRQIVYS
jgi:hypothetical protein